MNTFVHAYSTYCMHNSNVRMHMYSVQWIPVNLLQFVFEKKWWIDRFFGSTGNTLLSLVYIVNGKLC